MTAEPKIGANRGNAGKGPGTEPRAFASLLGRVLPLQLAGDDDREPPKRDVMIHLVGPNGERRRLEG